MKPLLTLTALLSLSLLFASPAMAADQPIEDKANINNSSPLEVFVDTLLGKDIDKAPEKPVEKE